MRLITKTLTVTLQRDDRLSANGKGTSYRTVSLYGGIPKVKPWDGEHTFSGKNAESVNIHRNHRTYTPGPVVDTLFNGLIGTVFRAPDEKEAMFHKLVRWERYA